MEKYCITLDAVIYSISILGDSVVNRLYDSADQFNSNSARQHEVVDPDTTHYFISRLAQENQIYQMQLNTSVEGTYIYARAKNIFN